MQPNEEIDSTHRTEAARIFDPKTNRFHVIVLMGECHTLRLNREECKWLIQELRHHLPDD
nr:hypothetical protein [Endozoicomonas sp.]